MASNLSITLAASLNMPDREMYMSTVTRQIARCHAHEAELTKTSKGVDALSAVANLVKIAAFGLELYLITAVPGVAHEVEGQLLLARLLRSTKLQLAGPFLLQGHTLHDQAGVVCRPPNQQPPILLLPPRIPNHRQTTGWVMHAFVGQTSQTSSDICPPCKARFEPPTLFIQSIHLGHVFVHASIAKPAKAVLLQTIRVSNRILLAAECPIVYTADRPTLVHAQGLAPGPLAGCGPS